MTSLTCHYLPRLDGMPAAALARLFPEPSSAAPLMTLLEESGIDGFNLGSLVVFEADVPILLLPLFETRFDLSAFVAGWARAALQAGGCLLPSVFRPRILGVGLVEGEWSEIGIAPQIAGDTLAAANQLASSALQTLAVEHGNDLVALYNFNCYGRLSEDVYKQFHRIQFRPCAQLLIDFSSMEEYLQRLSGAARKDLRRKMRVAPEVRVSRSRDVTPYLDRIYQLYQDTVARSSMVLGVHRRLFFEKVCERIPGAEYTLYFVEEELAAFNLLFVKQDALVDKYFCMNYRLGSKYNLYVLSWLENVRTCVERKIPLYYAGQGTEKTKAHLGATFIPSHILFKHRQPVFDRLLVWQAPLINKILSRLGYWPAAVPPPAVDALVGGKVITRNTVPGRRKCTMTKTADYAIEVDRLTKRYGDLLAVNDISFTVSKGEVFAFLGPNGAGKTTTVEVIETIRTPTAGKVTLLGMDVTRKKHEIVRRIGVLPQEFSSFDRITVRETLQYYARLYDCRTTNIDGLIELVNLQDKSNEQYKNLSGGLKQRLGIAIALVNDPEVVFLDEPTTGLDPRARREVWDVLHGLKKAGKTVFLTTHYMEEAELLADTVAIISRGKLIAMGSPGDLIEDNANCQVITLQAIDEKAFAIVRELGFEPLTDDRKNIRLRIESPSDVQEILNALKDAGSRYRGLDVRKPNLEEVFLKLTGEALHDSSGERGGAA